MTKEDKDNNVDKDDEDNGDNSNDSSNDNNDDKSKVGFSGVHVIKNAANMLATKDS